MGSPAVRLLKGGVEEPGRPFALCGQTGWRLRVFASPEREAFVRALQSMAAQKLALQLAGEGLPMDNLPCCPVSGSCRSLFGEVRGAWPAMLLLLILTCH